MSIPFNAERGLVVVSGRIWGPRGATGVTVALDTGASATIINAQRLLSVGYAPLPGARLVRVTTASGVEHAPTIIAARFLALRAERTSFPILCYTLPPSASVDGVLGLDFLRGHRLLLDFRTGRLSLD